MDGKTIKEYETLVQQTSTENETLTIENTNLQLTVKTLVTENRELKERTTATGGIRSRLFSIGLIAGILLILQICFAIRKLK